MFTRTIFPTADTDTNVCLLSFLFIILFYAKKPSLYKKKSLNYLKSFSFSYNYFLYI